MNKWWSLAVVLLASFAGYLAIRWSEAPAPESVTLAAGNPNGAYHSFAVRLQKSLAKNGLEAKVLATSGSLENAQLIREGNGNVIGFVQGGLIDDQQGSLRGIASLYYEPLWVFCTRDAVRRIGQNSHEASESENKVDLSTLAGMKVAVGPPGSGTRYVSMRLLRKLDLVDGDQSVKTHDSIMQQAAASLESNEIDAAFFVAGFDSKVIQRLLRNEDLVLISFERHEAYVREFQFLHSLPIPNGFLDLAMNIPDQPKTLLATTANLLSHENTHPAVIERVLAAVNEACQANGKLERKGEFPSVAGLYGTSIDPTAERVLEAGPSVMSNLLPYWVVNLLNRLKIFVITFIPAALLATKGVPLFVDYLASRRVYRYYARLYFLEHCDTSEMPTEQALEQLEELRLEVAKMKPSMRYRKDVYNLRLHIQLVSNDIRSRLSDDEP